MLDVLQILLQYLTICINLFVFQQNVSIQATGLINLDYAADSSTTLPTSTKSTTEAVPPTPSLAPTTTKQKVLTPGTVPLSTLISTARPIADSSKTLTTSAIFSTATHGTESGSWLSSKRFTSKLTRGFISEGRLNFI